MKRLLKAEVVVFASLLFLVMITFSVSVMDAASLEMIKSRKRADTNLALECVFAEYQKELLEHYDVFAMDAGYESGSYKARNLENRLIYYGATGSSHSIKRIQFLTDDGCRPFVEQAVRFMKEKYGLGFLPESSGDSWKKQEQISDNLKEDEDRLSENLKSMLEEEENELIADGNPIQHVAALRARPLLELVLPKEEKVSEKKLRESELLTHRRLNSGKGDFSEEKMNLGKKEDALFLQYLREHYSCFTDSSHGNEKVEKETNQAPLSYELEYVLAGKSSDSDNLEAVVKKLLKFRLAPNYLYIQSDPEKKAEAEAFALTLSTLALSPALTEVVTQAILFAWAYGESVMDLRSLLKGHKIPLIKTAASWQLSLSSLLKLGTEEDHGDGKHTPGGKSYQDYLEILLLMEPVEVSGKRALTIAEENLRKEYGLSWFHADHCVEKAEFSTTSSFRRGIRYKFKSSFGYR